MEPVIIGRANGSGGYGRSYWRDTEEFDAPPRWLRRRQLLDFFTVADESAAALAFDAVGRERGL